MKFEESKLRNIAKPIRNVKLQTKVLSNDPEDPMFSEMFLYFQT